MDKKDTIAIIRSLLSSTKSPYSVSSLFKDFKNETGIDMPLFGYKNVYDFLHSIPDTVKVTGIYPAQQVHLVTNEKSAHIASLVKRQKTDLRNQRKKTSLLDNEYYSRGIISNNKNTLQYKKKSHPFLRDDEKELVESKDQIPLQEKMSPKTSISVINTSSISSDLRIPDQVLGLHDQVLAINLNLHAGVGEYVEVCLCEIYNPSKFYLHFRKNKKKLSHLMSEVQLFYEQHEEMFRIPDASIKPHQICVALHKTQLKNHLWYRAEIIKVLDNYRVIVDLIDYGMTLKTFKKKLRLLHHDFSFLPRQAVLGSLANIKPLTNDMQWSKTACERFCDLASSRDLVAGVVNMKNEIPCMSVALSFTKGVEIHVNDTLVKEGFAVFENIPRENLSATRKTVGKLFYLQTSGNYFYEYSSKNFSTVENNTLIPRSGPIFYVPKNDRLKKMFSQ